MTTARVQPRPYTEESARATSRVTAEERERYIDWQYDLDDDLAAIESECRMPSERERQCHRENVGYGVVEPAPHKQPEMFVVSGYGPTPGEWRSYWRSLPDHDGPPMRAPSGVRWWREARTLRLVTPVSCSKGRTTAEWAEHIEGVTKYTQPDDGRKDERGRVRCASWYMENFQATRLITDAFDPPSKGGRGWCPKLAGVQT